MANDNMFDPGMYSDARMKKFSAHKERKHKIQDAASKAIEKKKGEFHAPAHDRFKRQEQHSFAKGSTKKGECRTCSKQKNNPVHD